MKRSSQPRFPATLQVGRRNEKTTDCRTSMQQDDESQVLFQATRGDFKNLNKSSAYGGTGRYDKKLKPKRYISSALESSCAGAESTSTKAYDLTPEASYQANDDMIIERPGQIYVDFAKHKYGSIKDGQGKLSPVKQQ